MTHYMKVDVGFLPRVSPPKDRWTGGFEESGRAVGAGAAPLLRRANPGLSGTRALCVRWAEVLGRKAPLLHLEGQPVYGVGGLVAAKAGMKMPGVKLVHQASGKNKPEFVVGHFWCALSLLAQGGSLLPHHDKQCATVKGKSYFLQPPMGYMA